MTKIVTECEDKVTVLSKNFQTINAKVITKDDLNGRVMGRISFPEEVTIISDGLEKPVSSPVPDIGKSDVVEIIKFDGHTVEVKITRER